MSNRPRTESIIERALAAAYPSEEERNKARVFLHGCTPHQRDSIRHLLMEAFDAVDAGRPLPEIPLWLLPDRDPGHDTLGRPKAAQKKAAKRKRKRLSKPPPGNAANPSVLNREQRGAAPVPGGASSSPDTPSGKPLPKFDYGPRSSWTSPVLGRCQVCGHKVRAEQGFQTIGGKRVCEQCAHRRFKQVNAPNPNALDPE